MRLGTALIFLAAPLLGACDPAGTPVVLNERLFELPSMKSAGGGCSTYDLRAPSFFGGGSSSGSGGGSAAGLPLVVEQRSDNDRVIVDVTDNGLVVIERIYDLAFFRAGKLDEFTATVPGEMMLLRYWGGIDPNGQPQCAPLTDDGPPAPAP
jgi:hypothetical protein